ncbi:MAG: NAD(P)H-hydrate dehydratase [Geminicoccaceae bacterium]
MSDACHAVDGGLYTIAQMRAADAAAIEQGIAGIELMENAGKAVADSVMQAYPPGKTIVLCGPGNNGGDGFVAARHLAGSGWPVRVLLHGDPGQLTGDAAIARDRWDGETVKLDPSAIEDAELAIDALFGAGLTRPIEGPVKAVLELVSAREIPIVAVDTPSGIHGDTGEVRGYAAKASMTVTFHRPKPGHYLLPGRSHVGSLVIADIGMPSAVDQSLGIHIFANEPALWSSCMPRRSAESHKYSYGHALVLGGGMASSGAARLAARASLRAGAGLVTVLCPASALPVYAASLTAVMVSPFRDEAAFAKALEDLRRNAILLGPGAGVGERLRILVETSLEAGKKTVLDADALTSFAERPDALFQAIANGGPCLLTPHEGEFSRLFDFAGDKLNRARRAAAKSGAVVLLKGADTVVASPDGRASIITQAPATLATAGSGDVLAGIALGLIAQSMPIFEAGSAAAWLHAAAARTFGPGLIAEDLTEQLPAVFASLVV